MPELLTTRDGSVLTVAFNRPGAANALTGPMYNELAEACARANTDDTVRCLVLRGSGHSVFPSGTDISTFTTFTSGDDGQAYEEKIEAIAGRLADVHVPTIAMIRGHAVGAGLMLAAACDIRICATETQFGIPIARTVGNCISQAGYNLLAERLGSSRLLHMLLTAQLHDATELHAAGFIAEVIADDELESRAAELSARITRLAPLTMHAAKLADAAHRSRSRSDTDFVRLCYGSRDFGEGVRAFLDHRPAVWTGA
jgi:enoyl-CoA hydratase/carnithine racemase